MNKEGDSLDYEDYSRKIDSLISDNEFLTNKTKELQEQLAAKEKELSRLNDFVSLCVNSYKMVNDKTSKETVLHIIQNRAGDLIKKIM